MGAWLFAILASAQLTALDSYSMTMRPKLQRGSSCVRMAFVASKMTSMLLAAALLGAGGAAAQIVDFDPGSSYELSGQGPKDIIVGHFDNSVDANVDLAIPSFDGDGDVTILFGDGGGGFPSADPFSVPFNARGIGQGDFDGDGDSDLAVVGPEGPTQVPRLRVYLGDGTGLFVAHAVIDALGTPTAVVSADFDEDGILDLAVADSDRGGVSTFRGIGAGSFSPPVQIPVSAGLNPGDILASDFDGDGHTDLATPETVFLGAGDGTFSKPGHRGGHAAGDMDLDGILDLVLASGTQVIVWLGNGDGTFEFGSLRSFTGASLVVARVTDFNRDSIPDVVVVDANTDAVKVLLGLGDGSLGASRTFVTGTEPGSLETGDWNADGYPDFAVPYRVAPGPKIGAFVSVHQQRVPGASAAPPQGQLRLGATTYAVDEGIGTVTLHVTRTGGSTGQVSVDYGTTDGTATAGSDYGSASGTLTFGDGVASQSFDLTITDDTVFEGVVDENLALSLSNPTGGATLGSSAGATLVIRENEPPPQRGTLRLSAGSFAVAENVVGGNLTVTVTRTGGSDGPVSADYTTIDGTAIAGSDYIGTIGTVTFADGVVSQAFTVGITDDAIFEGDKTFDLALSNGTGGATLGTPSIAVVTILEDENAPPVADSQAIIASEDVPRTITLTGSDLEGDPLTFAVVTGPTTGSLTGTPPNLTYVPPVNFNGPTSFSFVANDGMLDSAPATVSIDVTPINDAPVARVGPDQSVFVGDTIVLDGSASSDIDGGPLTYAWSLVAPIGSGAVLSNPTLAMPSFGVDLPGSYVAQLIVNDGFVSSTPASVTITMPNSAPVATGRTVSIGEDRVNRRIRLAGSDIDGDPLTFAVATSPAHGTLSLSNVANLRVYVPDPDFSGEDSFTFVAFDGNLESLPATVTIQVAPVNDVPVADPGLDQSVLVGDTVTLDGSTSSDADGDPLSFFWSLTVVPAGSNATLSDPTALMPSFAVDVDGSYVAQLIVDDGIASSLPATLTISTQNSAPVAVPGPDQSVFVGDTVTLDGSASSDADGDPLSFFWSLTVVPAGSGAMLLDATALMPSFDVDLEGSYVAQLIVDDGVTSSLPATVTISTQNSAPLADPGPDQSVFVSDTVTLDGSGSSDADGDPLTFFWSLTLVPAGSAAVLSDPTAIMPSLIADLPGSYVAQLIVNDGLADSAPQTVAVNAESGSGNMPVADAGADQSVLVGDPVTLDGSASNDVDGDPLTFFWSLTLVPAGSAAVLSDPTAIMPLLLADLPGSYVAQLIVNDGLADSAPDTVAISIVEVPPTDPGAEIIELEGLIEAVAPSNITVSGLTVWYTAATTVTFKGGCPAEEFAVGYRAHLLAQPNLDGSVTGTEIEMKCD
jgi:hypothetical protein